MQKLLAKIRAALLWIVRESPPPPEPVSVSGALFHATPADRLALILENGLLPRAENRGFRYPPRVYCAVTEPDAVRIAYLLRSNLVLHRVHLPTTPIPYAILRIDAAALRSEFFRDPMYAGGVYTDEAIPPDALSIVGVLDGEALTRENWREFSQWYQGEAPKPSFLKRWDRPRA